MIQIALTERLKGLYPTIYPEDFKDSMVIKGFQDLIGFKKVALEKMKPYAGECVEVLRCGGIAQELLAVIVAADELHINLSIGLMNTETGIYYPQKVTWKKGKGKKKPDQYFLLCGGRHENVCEKHIFEPIADDKRFDFEWIEKNAEDNLEAYRGQTVGVYLTGLSTLAISTLNAAEKLGISLIFYHYDRDEEEYFPQYVDE